MRYEIDHIADMSDVAERNMVQCTINGKGFFTYTARRRRKCGTPTAAGTGSAQAVAGRGGGEL